MQAFPPQTPGVLVTRSVITVGILFLPFFAVHSIGYKTNVGFVLVLVILSSGKLSGKL
jgi:hypothetical protein